MSASLYARKPTSGRFSRVSWFGEFALTRSPAASIRRREISATVLKPELLASDFSGVGSGS
ncbi:hypothetical protein ACFPRL_34795 [Pseudoclavibacter helvolus]